jgi:RNA polymerase sigma-70 factor (ECF subfamily)
MSNHPEIAPIAVLATVAGARSQPDRERLSALVERHLEMAGRILRNLGALPDEVEDLVHQAFSVTAARLGDIEPGKERAFLVETAVRLAAGARRGRALSREIATSDLPEVADGGPSPEELSDQKRARSLLDGILDDMEHDLRAVFVLYEVEEMTMAEIASILQLAPGTVASRLRRARGDFLARVHRIGRRARMEGGGK